MAKKTVAELKAFFETGDKPTESEFADVMDSFINLLTESEIEATILVNVPVVGDGSGGKVLKKGDALIQMGEYSINDTVITSDNGAYAAGGKFFVGDAFAALGFNLIEAFKADSTKTEMKFDANNLIKIANEAGFKITRITTLDKFICGSSGCKLGFFGTNPTHARQSIVGSKGGNIALGNLLTALHNLGLITDNTT